MSTKELLAYSKDKEAILSQLESDRLKGLSASQVKERQARYGENAIKEEEHRSTLQKFIDQFKDFMIIVLLVAAAVSAGIGLANGEGIADAVIILIVVLLNAVIGVIQEAKAEDAIDALKNISSPEANVLRDGSHQKVKSTELVLSLIHI